MAVGGETLRRFLWPLVVALVGLLVGWLAWEWHHQAETWLMVGLVTLYYVIWAWRGWKD